MKRAIVLLVVQVGVILGWAGYHAAVRAYAPTFRLPLDPQDPYDLLRGRYFILNPRDRTVESTQLDPQSTEWNREHVWRSDDVLVGFCPAGTSYRVCAVRPLGTPTDGRATYWARASAWEVDDGKWSIDLGLHRFFIPNRAELPRGPQDGWELEVSYRPGQRLLPRRLWFRGRPWELG